MTPSSVKEGPDRGTVVAENKDPVIDDALAKTIEKTIQSLGKHISRPRLLPKFLCQPPFLYMHDIVNNVIKNYGLLQGLFTPDQLNRLTARSTRENRINYFQKLVAGLRATTGEVLINHSWRKLAIGQLPFASNEILQVIALALDNRMSSEPAVRKLTGMSLGLDGNSGGVKRSSDETLVLQKRSRVLTVWDLDADDEQEAVELAAWYEEEVQRTRKAEEQGALDLSVDSIQTGLSLMHMMD